MCIHICIYLYFCFFWVNLRSLQPHNPVSPP